MQLKSLKKRKTRSQLNNRYNHTIRRKFKMQKVQEKDILRVWQEYANTKILNNTIEYNCWQKLK